MYPYPTNRQWLRPLLSLNNNMYDTRSAFATPEEIRARQEASLQNLLQYLAAHSPFYQAQFQKQGIDISNINSLDQLTELPVTTKSDLQLHNWDFCCVPRTQVAEYMATSGTLGTPVTIALTENDLQRLAYNEYCSFLSAGGSSEDVYQLMLTLDRQFMAGIAYYLGIRKLGAGLVRVGPGAPFLHWETIQRVKPTVLIGVPSFVVKLVEYAEAKGYDLTATPVNTIICIGEAIRREDGSLNTLGERITRSWPVKLVGTYASTEMQTAFTECPAGNGGHLNAELLILELLDDNNQPVAPGEAGEVTITTLGVEGMPLLRYKTGDICRLLTNTCSCGRNTPRLSAVLGRKQQMIKLKGTSFYPPALFDVLHQLTEISDYVVELQTNELGTDEVFLHVLVERQDERVERKIKDLLRSRLRVIPELLYVTAADLQRMQFPDGGRKALKLLDRRRQSI